jgi:hypothetical protein
MIFVGFMLLLACSYFSPRLGMFGKLPEGRDFSPAETAVTYPLFLSRPAQLAAASCAGRGTGEESERPCNGGLNPRPGVSTFSKPQIAWRGLRPQRVERPLPTPSLPSCSNLIRRQLSMASLAFRWLWRQHVK